MSGSSSIDPSGSVSAVSTPINAGQRPDSAPALGSSQASTPPNAGGKFLDPRSAEEKKLRRTSLMVPLPKQPSSESLSFSPGPASPGDIFAVVVDVVVGSYVRLLFFWSFFPLHLIVSVFC
ncbi:uncharacterized protein LOC129761863 [Toxorhynchites rutilus septentrionalis]|uniref:uncharacterized protein LOC129761863 n=1 Tax=Toxorhynchites rutilus septentrionalis TaxID=329112 RepID=UPI00247844C8|nr:uncharacterized protein LOC129761863 [Toxorhynchites rutilus septentrionalis]